jgi:hypothetical protein
MGGIFLWWRCLLAQNVLCKVVQDCLPPLALKFCFILFFGIELHGYQHTIFLLTKSHRSGSITKGVFD